MTSQNLKIEAYTDGSCMVKKDGIYCGYGIHFPNGEIKDVSKVFTKGPLTNQRAELYAIYKAIKKAEKHNFSKLTIFSDSRYSIQSVTTWIKAWKKNGWKTAANKEVLNQDIIKKIDTLLEKHREKINFIHVRSHSKGTDTFSVRNDIADKLAKDGALKLKQMIKNQ